MPEPAFDKARADRIIQEIRRATIVAEDYRDADWQSIAVVINLDNRNNMYGYYYTDAKWHPATPDFDVMDLAIELQEAMRVPGAEPWKKALIQISRATGGIAMDFDYDGTRWKPDMKDPGAFALSLKPAAG